MEPAIKQSMGVLPALSLKLNYVKSALSSCVTKGGKCTSTIDYFAITDYLVDVVDVCFYCDSTSPKPLRPTYLFFLPKPTNVMVTILKEPPKLPIDPPFGPTYPPSCWIAETNEINNILRGLRCRDGASLETPSVSSSQTLTKAMEVWFRKAESDLIEVLGSKSGSRNRGHQHFQLHWRRKCCALQSLQVGSASFR